MVKRKHTITNHPLSSVHASWYTCPLLYTNFKNWTSKVVVPWVTALVKLMT